MNLSESSNEVRNPWWLFAIGLYEIVTLIFIVVHAGIFLSNGKEALTPAFEDPEDPTAKNTEKLVGIIFIALVVVFILSLLFSGVMTILMVTALISGKETTKRRFLKYWTYGSYALITLDCLSVVAKIKSLLANAVRAENDRNTGTGNTMIILAIVMTIADVVVRGVGVYAIGKFVKRISAKIWSQNVPQKA